MGLPPLKPLHTDDALIALKLEFFRRLPTDDLIRSLSPGQPGALKVRTNGTMIDGHHRIKVLRERRIDVDRLPREVVDKKE